MVRIAPLLVALFLTTAASAVDTQQYLVATKRPFGAGTLTAVRDSVDQQVDLREAHGFRSFRGFAADLTAEEAAILESSREVRWIEPVVERHAFDVQPDLLGQAVPHGIISTGARAATVARRSDVVNVVVIDTGVDYNHPDLKAVYAGGYNAFDDSSNPFDDDHHGTHVSGIITAAENSVGVVGMAPGVRLWGVKVLDSMGRGSTREILKGLDWVLDQKKALGGNWIINLSLGSERPSTAEREAFEKVTAAGVLVFAATGNSSTHNTPAPVAFPAAYDTVIAVGAVDEERNLAFFSNQGPEVDFAAPGVDVLSTVPIGTRYEAYIYDGHQPELVRYVNGSAHGTVSGEYVYCGLGAPADFPPTVNGRIALIRRGGGITFAEKTINAMLAGAKAVAIFNSDQTSNPWSLQSDTPVEWPLVLRLTLETGEALAAKGTGTLTVSYDHYDYEESSGTSMSCPHVAGAAALLWMLAPNASAEAVLNALRTTAIDLGDPGQDDKFGLGLINVYAAAYQLAPSAMPAMPTTGRAPGRRGH